MNTYYNVYAVGEIKKFRKVNKGSWNAVSFDIVIHYEDKDYSKNCIYESDNGLTKIEEFYQQFRDGDIVKIKASREKWRKNKSSDGKEFFSTVLVIAECKKMKDEDEGQRKQEEEVLRNQIENEHKKQLENVATQTTVNEDDLPF